MQRWFLSYNSQDLGLMSGLEAAVRRTRAAPEIFFAPKALRAGGYWLPALAEGIADATAFVLLVGEKGLGPWQVIEYCEALDRRVKSPNFPVVLVLLEGQPAPGLPFLRQLHWIVTADVGSEQCIARLMDATAGLGTRPGELWRYTAPYRGLAAMTEADSDFFFGRTPETLAVLRTIEATPDRLPVLLGNSGVGKSSLAQAGVLAALKRQALPEGAAASSMWPAIFRDSRRWCFLKLSPGTDPLKALVEPFLRTWQMESTDPLWEKRQREWIEALLAGNATIGGLLDATERRYEELGQPSPPAFFLYIDQGEELYVRSEERKQRRFSEVLANGVGDPRLRVMMSMRSDFFGALQNDEPLFASHWQINVPPLHEAELRQVVSRPAELLSARFENAGLAHDMARRTAEESVKDTGALPLLSYLLDDMWTQMVRRGDGTLRLPAEAFELGGVLADRANAFLANRPAAEPTLRRILTLKLATVREDGEPTRRRALRSEFSDEEWRIVSELADHPHRLLVTAAPEGGETFAEVAHEAIFRRWDKLREWIAAERDFLIWKSGLEGDHRSWEHAPAQTRNDALLMGLALAQAQGWLAKRAEDLPKSYREFINLSLQREALERAQKEGLRRRVFWTAIAALAAVTVLAVFSLLQWGKAEQQRIEAVKQEQMARQERNRAEQEHARGDQALGAATQIADALVFDMAQNFRNLGLSVDVMNKMLDRAIQGYDQAIKLNPNAFASYNGRGTAYRIKGDPDRALQDYDQALKLNPAIAYGYNNRGNAYHDKKENDRAIEDYDKALELDPKYMFAYNNRGNAYYDKNDYDRAIGDYDKALELDPKYSIAYNNRGRAYVAKGDYDRAIQDYDQAFVLDPRYVVAYNNRGIAYYNKKDYERAIQDYEQAIKLDPKYAFAYYNLGLVYAAKGNTVRAIADYDQAIALDPNYVSAYNARGNAFFDRQDFDRSIQDYGRAIEIDPKNAAAYNSRGHAYANQGDYDRGIRDYDRAIALDPQNVSAYNNRGSAYYNKKVYARAIDDYNQAIKLDPKYVFAYHNLGLARAATGDYDRAIRDYDQAIALDPEYVSAYNNRGISYYDRKDYDRAIQDYDRTIKLDPKYVFAYNNRGRAYGAKGDYARAIEDYSQAVAIDPNYAVAFANRGLAYATTGDYDRAIQDYGQAIKLDPKYVAAYNHRGNAYFDKKDYDRAIADYDQAIKLDATFTFAYYNLGLVYAAKGDPDRAIENYSQAIAADPQYAVAYYARGNVFYDKKDYERAIEDCDRAIKLDPKYVAAYNNRGRAYSAKGDQDRALADYNRAIELDPKYVIAYSNRGNTWRRKGDYARAFLDYDRAIALDPNYVLAHSGRGYTNFNEGDFAAAAADFQRSMEIKDDPFIALWRHLARARMGETAASEFADYVQRQTSRDWPYPALELYLGRGSAPAMLAAAQSQDMRCEAQFFLGEWHLLRGSRAEAIAALRTAADTCPPRYVQADAAAAELKRLNP